VETDLAGRRSLAKARGRAQARKTGKKTTVSYRGSGGRTETVTVAPPKPKAPTPSAPSWKKVGTSALGTPIYEATIEGEKRQVATENISEYTGKGYAAKEPTPTRQVAEQPFTTYAAAPTPTAPTAMPTGLTRYTAELYQTPGAAPYTVTYAQPLELKPPPPGVTVYRAAPPALAEAARVAKEREEFYRQPLPAYKRAAQPKPGAYVPLELREKTWLQEIDVEVSGAIKRRVPKVAKTAYKLAPLAFKGTKAEPVIQYGRGFTEEIVGKPITTGARFVGATAVAAGVGLGLAAIPAGAVATGAKGITTAIGAGVAVGTGVQAYGRVKLAPPGMKAYTAGKITAELTPIAAGIVAGGRITKAYGPRVQDYAVTRQRYYRATGELRFRRLPLEFKRKTYPYLGAIPVEKGQAKLAPKQVLEAYKIKGRAARRAPPTGKQMVLGEFDPKFDIKYKKIGKYEVAVVKKGKKAFIFAGKKGQAVLVPPKLKKPKLKLEQVLERRVTPATYQPYQFRTLYGLRQTKQERLAFATALAPVSRQMLGVRPVLRPRLRPAPQVEALRFRVEPITQPRTITLPRQDLGGITFAPPIQVPRLDEPAVPARPIAEVTRPRPRRVAVPDFDWPRLRRKRKKAKPVKPMRVTKYKPSLVAAEKMIYGKKPKRLTGLEVRPILYGGKF
jgi:hypothetical protein